MSGDAVQQQKPQSLNGWVAYLGHTEIPVLKQTARDLAALRENPERLSARGVAGVVARDPVMTVKLLRYLQQHKHRRQEHEVMQIEQALLMMGVEAFFVKIAPEPLAEDMPRGDLAALIHLLHVVRRAQRASSYALDWAVRLRDLHFEEVRIAALLHDLAEMLMWCFAPDDMLKILSMQQQDKSLRSQAAQEQVLGFPLAALQSALAREWNLPKLLLALMDSARASEQRVRNVVLAVNLARHSANGWDDAALPDDYQGIAELLHIKPEEAMVMLEAEAGLLCDLGKPH
ncbi:MAG: signal transduction protein [Gallionellaceae bacterium]|nr:MAG: signal transduction protein [Gallionellaceae bacterium]